MPIHSVNASGYMNIGAIDLEEKSSSITAPCSVAKVAIVVAEFFRSCATAVKDLVDLLGRVFSMPQRTPSEITLQNPQIRGYYEGNIANSVLKCKRAIANGDTVSAERLIISLKSRIASLQDWYPDDTEDIQALEDTLGYLFIEFAGIKSVYR